MLAMDAKEKPVLTCMEIRIKLKHSWKSKKGKVNVRNGEKRSVHSSDGPVLQDCAVLM